MTLHLARAIQAANPAVPDVRQETPGSSTDNILDSSPKDSLSADGDSAQVWQAWRESRQAVVHSVEVSQTYSKHAEKKVVGGFRRGLYSPHIDFHVANVNDWIDGQLKQRDHESFLRYVFLDMPSSHRYLPNVMNAMKEDALIAIFVPSITQIGDCIREIKAHSLPLRMEKTLELGDGISNGRLWDVRLAFKRAKNPIDESSMTGPLGSKAKDLMEPSSTSGLRDGDEDETVQDEVGTQSDASSTIPELEDGGNFASLETGPGKGMAGEEPVMVCRPKVGERVIGGGFVGLWRRTNSN